MLSFDLSGKGGPISSYATAGLALRIIALGKPPHPAKDTFVKVEILKEALRRSSRMWRKDRIRNVTIRQQIGLEETVIKEVEQKQPTWYGHVQRMADGRLPRIALRWMPKQKRARGRPKKNWMEGHERKKPTLRPVGR